MMRVVRIDTAELIGYLAPSRGPLARGAKACMFDAWRHPDGRLRHAPDRDGAAACVRLSIPLRRPFKAEPELMVPPDYLDFIRHHPSFHLLPPAPRRRQATLESVSPPWTTCTLPPQATFST